MDANASDCSESLSTAPLHELAPTTAKLTNKKIKDLKEMGINIKTGKFSENENNILKDNWKKFCVEYSVTAPHTHLALGFFLNSEKTSKEDRERANMLRKNYNLLLTLARGLPDRTIRDIYQRARLLCSGLYRAKHLTKNKRQAVLESRIERLTRQWIKIAEKTLCDPKSVRQIIRSGFSYPYFVRNKKGKWNAFEEKILMKSIKEVIDARYKSIKKILDVKTSLAMHGQFVEHVNWHRVASKMKKLSAYQCVRSANQCRQHWLTKLSSRVLANDSNVNHNWRKKMDTLKMLYYMKHNYENEEHIDWQRLAQKFAYVTNRNELIRIWYQIKRTVDHGLGLNFKQMLDHIIEKKESRFNITKDDTEILRQFCSE